MTDEKTINTIGEKTAANIAGAGLNVNNPYNEAIVTAARTLVDTGKGHAHYETQWGSGTTLWSVDDAKVTVPFLGPTTEDKNKLSDRDEHIILDAIKNVGKEEAYGYMFEDLWISNADEIKAFMDFAIKYDLPMGSANIHGWWADFQDNPNQSPLED